MWRKWAPYVAVAAMRARFLVSPMATDEGGYLAVARAWFRGAHLYGTVWVDRPQGLLVVYGLLDRVGLGNTVGIRLLGFVACAVSMWACGRVAAVLHGDRARLATVWAAGVALSLPQIEGFTANAELLSCSAAAVGLALALTAVWDRDMPDVRLLVLAGAAAGTAVTLKQSGFDATAAAAVATVFAAVHGRWSVKRIATVVGAAAAGAAVPLGAMVLHAAFTGFGDWWWAVAGVRLDLKGALAPTGERALRETVRAVGPLVLPAVLVAVPLLVASLRRAPRAFVVLAAWSAAALGAFWLGGLFHRHYWTILMYPLATGTGVALSMLRRRDVAVAAALVVLAVPVWSTVTAVRMGDSRVAAELNDDTRLTRNEATGAWVDANVPRTDGLWVMCASSALYALTHRDPPVRYLWFAYYRAVPEALDGVISWLSGANAPEWIVQAQRPARCDPSGRLGAVVGARYEPVEGVPGFVMLRRAP